MKYFIALSFTLILGTSLSAQCPTNEADLADGGTFSGNCNISVGADITISGAVIWTSGTLNINGNNGDVNISGSLTINGGTVNTTDNSDGDIDVLSGGVITIAAGATLNARDEIRVRNGGSIDVTGTLTSTTSFIDIDAGGAITVNSGGIINTGSDDDILVQGTLTMNAGSVANAGDDIVITGTLTANGTLNSVDDFDVNGGTVNVGSSGVLNIGDDLNVDNSTFTSAGTIDIGDNAIVEGGSTFTNSGTMVIDSDLELRDGGTTVTNTGVITVMNDLVVDNSGSTLVNNNLINVYDDITNDGTISGTGGINLCDPTGTEATNNFTNNGTYSMTGVMCMCTTNNNNVFTNNGTVSPGTTIDQNCNSLNVALPIELLFFNATREEKGVLIQWATASEENNDFMEVQRSFDGLNWTTISRVNGSGNSNQVSNYMDFDTEAPEANLYYRLKQTDINGNAEVFEMVSVRWKESQTSNQGTLNVYPNPILRGNNLTLNLEGLKGHELDVRMYDFMGREVHNKSVQVGSHSQLEDFEVIRSLSPGQYFILAESANFSFKTKIVVQ